MTTLSDESQNTGAIGDLQAGIADALGPSTARGWVPTPWYLTSASDLPSNVIDRPHLRARVDESLDIANVILIVAPPGFGKSVLLTSWAARATSTVAWLTLEPTPHDDPVAVLMGIVAALERALHPGRASILTTRRTTSPHTTDITGLMTTVAELLTSAPSPVTMVIDDAQHAPSAVGSVISALTRVSASRLRVICAGTAGFETGFSRLMMAHPGILMDARELAMTVPEIIATAHLRNPDHTIDADAATAVVRETGGWPAAVALRLLPGDTPSARIHPPERLPDYIREVVLPSLRPPLRQFVLDATTSLTLGPGLAAALTDDPSSSRLLDECAANGIFLDRFVDDSGAIMYRWHDLFARACRTLVRRTDPAHAQRLHARAARYLLHRHAAEALTHASFTEDATLIREMICASWLQLLVEQDARTLHEVCVSAPDTLQEDPTITLIRATCIRLLGDGDNARLVAARAFAHQDESAQWSRTQPFAQILLADGEDSLLAAVTAALHALTVGDSTSTLHPYQVFIAGWGMMRTRQRPQEAIRLLRAAVDEATRTRRTVLANRAQSNLLFALVYGGHLTAGHALITGTPLSQETVDDWYRYDGGIGMFAHAFLAYWRADRPLADRLLTELSAGTSGEQSYPALARLYLVLIISAGHHPAAIRTANALLTGISSENRHGVPWATYRALAQAALHAGLHAHADAVAIVQQFREQRNVPLVRAFGADIARQAGRGDLAMELLSGLTATERRVSYVAASAETTAALVAWADGDAARARLRLRRAIAAAAPEGILWPFLSAGEEIRPLLDDAASSSTPHTDFIAHLLTRLLNTSSRIVGEPLSPREQEVYGYLGTTMTAEEIAAALFVSTNTVRSHQRSIYRKLGVTSRRDAVRLRL
ncbi:hypothetical protein ASF63_15465 [Microbacterium sp. Leaf320]|nr:hypothetical protein ASF63_15465 [Microbacterium sp. Leaf320]